MRMLGYIMLGLFLFGLVYMIRESLGSWVGAIILIGMGLGLGLWISISLYLIMR